MSFPRYLAYKNSGIEWLGKVPAHWQLPPLYLRYEVLLGKMLDEKRITGKHLLPYLRNIDVQWDRVNTRELPEMDIAPGELHRFTLRLGDILVCEGGEVGRTAIWQGELEHCAFQKAIHRLRPLTLDEDTRFLFYCMQFAVANEVFIAEGNSNTISHLTAEKFRLYRFPTPPKLEQSFIAAFLNRETAKIDALIAEQRRLIELLKEKRQAVISHAVTKGLNSDVPLKPSGIEWLGYVPSHWSMVELRRVVRKGTSITYGIVQAGPDTEGGIPYIRTSDMAGEELPETGYMRTTPDIDAAYARSKVRANDLVVAIRASLGKGLLVPDYLDGANLTQGTAKISPNEQLLPRFLYWAFNSRYCQINVRMVAKGTTFLEITLDALRRICLAVPPLDEQTEIVAKLDRDIANLELLTMDAKLAIDRLQERRAALISAAVTGQIDVRALVAAEAA